ncbi:MAG: amino acid permease [Oscillospiraceae bacterium]|nr:amino acid permease [Oscillospiraceae bacterium]
MKNQMTAESPQKYLSRLDVWALAYGCMVGWGAFVMPGTTFLPVAGPAGTVIAMLIGMLIMLVIANNFAYLMKRIPRSGGVYAFTKEAFGREHAFISSWFLCLSYLTIVFLNGTALFVVLRTIFGNTIQTGFHYSVAGNPIYFGEVIISVAALGSVGILFITSRSVLHKVHTLFAVLMAVGILILAAVCIPHIGDAIFDFGSQNTNRAYGIFSIAFLAPWAFVGFEVVSFDTPDFKFPVAKSKRIIFIGIIIAAFGYTAMALVGASAVPDGFANWGEYISSLGSLTEAEAVPTFYAARKYLGDGGLILIGLCAFGGVMTGIISGYRATMRVLTTMADDKILSEQFSKKAFSILFVMVFSVTMALFGRNTLSWFVDLTSFGAIMCFGYTSAAAHKLAKKDHDRQVKLTGLLGMVISIIFVIVQLVPRLTAMEAMGCEAFLLLSFWCLLGFFFYWRTVTRSKQTDYSGISTSGIVLFALLLYSVFMWLAKLIASKENMSEVQNALFKGGIVLLILVFLGLAVMLYVQNLVRKKHETAEHDKIRALESSLAKSRFLFNMSHDIRTPMNAIIGYTNLAMKEQASPKLHDYLSKIDRSNRHLLNLINDILEMSRIENGKLELECIPADLCRIFDGISELFDEQMKQKKMNFQVHSAQVKDRYVWCDVKNLNRVIINLLGNSYKFTPEGGKVSVSVLQVGKAENGYAAYEIRITDNGIGMSREFAEKMFSPFERERSSTDSGVEGTGLGLSISKSIIDLMGGTITVNTAQGSGTEIILNLCFMTAEESDLPQDASETKEHAAKQDFSQKRLLIAEDNAINLEIACMILTQAGFKVETAENGQAAVDMVAASDAGYYDAVLMDIQMPVMDGYTAAKKIRSLSNKAHAEIPIVAMTANAFKEDEEAALAAGMQAHVAKPIDVDALLKTLSDILYGTNA